MKKNWNEKYGQWAVVTGAAQGIGAEFARQCGQHGLNVMLVDRNGEQLAKTVEELSKELDIELRSVELDLSREDFLETMAMTTSDLEVGVLVNNAAVATVGPFLQLSPSLIRLQNKVNIIAPLLLIQHYGAAMVERGRGAVINVSSRTGELGTPNFSTYAAIKAFLSNCGEALWFELKEHGVDVFTLKPDQTATPGFLTHDPGDHAAGIQSTEDCVAEAFEWTGKSIGRIPVASGREEDAKYKAMPREEALATISAGMQQIFD